MNNSNAGLKNIILINGSPRKSGTSYSFARTIKQLAERSGHQAEILHLLPFFNGKTDLQILVKKIADCDILGLIAPVYSDTLPYSDIWLLEKLADEYKNVLEGKTFFAVGQCGFPDQTRLQPLLENCHYFARQTGMAWSGGIAFGGGPMINGANLEDLGTKGQRFIEGFQLAVEAILAGEPIPGKSQELLTFTFPPLMRRLITWYMNYRIKKDARKAECEDYKARPYLN
ncbi:MAG: NAD(P)H-dependent oxidoreductase [Bacillota bacterium]|nr:NAD(P)H-dependent oxidoreductase [Bacillota bacterium]